MCRMIGFFFLQIDAFALPTIALYLSADNVGFEL